ncbi:TPA: hypothetical protein KDX59_004540 [Vibrio parahaemolyticus]|nr:hypothetical protein [Vibrio parahaemolyticus]
MFNRKSIVSIAFLSMAVAAPMASAADVPEPTPQEVFSFVGDEYQDYRRAAEQLETELAALESIEVTEDNAEALQARIERLRARHDLALGRFMALAKLAEIKGEQVNNQK